MLLPGAAESPDAVQRFFAEARAASMIRHPGIVEVFDCDVDASGAAFIVMEYLEGVGLGRFIADGQSQGLDTLLNIGAQVANAMGAAHERGIVHRDLKPDNVFLCQDDAAGPGGRVKMLDFGIAKLVAAADAPSLTAEGLVMGTPRYMSPEQVQGSRQVGPASDVYSFGCILFQMACGQPPFVQDMTTAVMIAHLSQDPPHPASLAPALPPALDALIVQMLAKAPEDRPSDMKEVERRLRDLRSADDLPTAAVPVEPAPTARVAPTRPGPLQATRVEVATGPAPAPPSATSAPPTPRRSGPAIVAALVVLGLASLGGALLLRARSARRAEAQAARVRVDAAVARAGEVPAPADCRATDHGALVRLASVADTLQPAAGASGPAAAAAPTAAEEWAMVARVELAAGRDAPALAAAEHALSLCPGYAAAHYLAGKAADRLGRRDRAMAEYRRALEGQDRFLPPRYNLALLQLKAGDSAGAAATLDQLVAVAPDARALLLRGQARLNTGDVAGAETDLLEVVRLEPNLADAWALLGTAHARAGHVPEATRAFCRGKELGSAAAAANCRG